MDDEILARLEAMEARLTAHLGETPDKPADRDLFIRDQLARIDRNIAETQRLHAESRKFGRDPWFVLLSAVIAAIAAAITAVIAERG